jgi:hypothetical protein
MPVPREITSVAATLAGEPSPYCSIPGPVCPPRTSLALADQRQRYFTPICTIRPSSALVITPKVGVPVLRPGLPSRA